MHVRPDHSLTGPPSGELQGDGMAFPPQSATASPATRAVTKRFFLDIAPEIDPLGHYDVLRSERVRGGSLGRSDTPSQ